MAAVAFRRDINSKKTRSIVFPFIDRGERLADLSDENSSCLLAVFNLVLLARKALSHVPEHLRPLLHLRDSQYRLSDAQMSGRGDVVALL